jgi:hypothetical protein
MRESVGAIPDLVIPNGCEGSRFLPSVEMTPKVNENNGSSPYDGRGI